MAFNFYAPLHVLARKTPAPYVVRETIPGFGTVVLQALNCAKGAAGGIDRGPGSLVTIYVLIRTPEGAGSLAELIPAALLNVSSNNAGLRSAIELHGPELANMSAEIVRTVSPLGHDALDGRVLFRAEVEYRLIGTTDKGSRTATWGYRLYFGPDPNEQFFDSTSQLRLGSGDGAGYAEFRSGSFLWNLFDGPPKGPILSIGILSSNLTWTALDALGDPA